MRSTNSPASTLVCRFLAEILGRTLHLTDDMAHQQAVQAFVDELGPWLPPSPIPMHPYTPLFSRMELDEQTGKIEAELTPEGLICFRGWLHRQGLSPMMSTS